MCVRFTRPSPTSNNEAQYHNYKALKLCLLPSLFYLKKYVSGPALKILEGAFYRNDKEAYNDAWSRLNSRYGQPFINQKAFREKLANWPRIGPKDAIGLREFSDFLNACQDAMSHVKGLHILNDSREQKTSTETT